MEFNQTLNHNAERYLLILDLLRRSICNNALPFGGVVRDVWLRRYYAKQYYDYLKTVDILPNNSLSYNDVNIHPESYVNRRLQPRDIDLLVKVLNVETEFCMAFLKYFTSKFSSIGGRFDKFYETTEYIANIHGKPMKVFTSRFLYRYGSIHTGYRHISIKFDVVFVTDIDSLLQHIPFSTSRLLMTGCEGTEFIYSGITRDIAHQLCRRVIMFNRHMELEADALTKKLYVAQTVRKINYYISMGWRLMFLNLSINCLLNDDTSSILKCGLVCIGDQKFPLFATFENDKTFYESGSYRTQQNATDNDDEDDRELININNNILNMATN